MGNVHGSVASLRNFMYTRLDKSLNLFKVESLINKSSSCVLMSLYQKSPQNPKKPLSSQFLNTLKSLV